MCHLPSPLGFLSLKNLSIARFNNRSAHTRTGQFWKWTEIEEMERERENSKRMRKWRENEKMERKCRENEIMERGRENGGKMRKSLSIFSLSFYFLNLSPFSLSLSIFSFSLHFLSNFSFVLLFPLHFLASLPFSRRPPASCATLVMVMVMFSNDNDDPHAKVCDPRTEKPLADIWDVNHWVALRRL